MASNYLEDNIAEALEIAFNYAQIDGGHHKAWVIDQMVRSLLGNDYEGWITTYESGEDGPHTYTWDTGIAP